MRIHKDVGSQPSPAADAGGSAAGGGGGGGAESWMQAGQEDWTGLGRK